MGSALDKEWFSKHLAPKLGLVPASSLDLPQKIDYGAFLPSESTWFIPPTSSRPYDNVRGILEEKGYLSGDLSPETTLTNANIKSWFRGTEGVRMNASARHAAMLLERTFPASQGWSFRADESIKHSRLNANVDLIVENKRLNQASVIHLNSYGTLKSRNWTDLHGGMAAHLYQLSHPGMNVTSHVLSVGHNTFPTLQLTQNRSQSIQDIFYPNPIKRLFQQTPDKVEATKALKQAKEGLSSGLPIWKGGNFNGKTFTALDIETGGWVKKAVGSWDASNRDILSISAIKFGRDETTGQWYELNRYNRFYNPQDTTSPQWHQAYEVHRLSESRLRALRKAYDMPSLVDSYTAKEAKRLGRFLGDSVLVTHNGAQFDIPSLQRWGNSLNGRGHIDTMIAAQNWRDSKGLEVFENIGLADVYKQIFNKEMPNHHFAEADAITTMQIAINMMGKNNSEAAAMRFIGNNVGYGHIKSELGSSVVRGWGVGGANINGRIPYSTEDIIEASKYIKEAAKMAKQKDSYGMSIGAQLQGKGQYPIAVYDIDGTITDTYSIGKDITKAFDAGDFKPFYDTKHMVSPEAIAQIIHDVRSGKQVHFNSAALGTEFRGKKLPFAEAPDFDLNKFLQAGVDAKRAQFQEILSRLPKDVANRVRDNLIVTQPALGETKAGTLIKRLGYVPENIDIYEDEQRQLDAYLKEIPNARTHNVLPTGFTFNGRFWAPDAPLPPTFPNAHTPPSASAPLPKEPPRKKVTDAPPSGPTPEEEAAALASAANKSGVPLSVGDAGGMHLETGGDDYAATIGTDLFSSSLTEVAKRLEDKYQSLATIEKEYFKPSLNQLAAYKDRIPFGAASKFDVRTEEEAVLRELAKGGVINPIKIKSWDQVDPNVQSKYQLYRDSYLYNEEKRKQAQEDKEREREVLRAEEDEKRLEHARNRLYDRLDDSIYGEKLNPQHRAYFEKQISMASDMEGIYQAERALKRGEFDYKKELALAAEQAQEEKEYEKRKKGYGWDEKGFWWGTRMSEIDEGTKRADESLKRFANTLRILGDFKGYDYERINKVFSQQIGSIHSSLGGLIPKQLAPAAGHLFGAVSNAWNQYWAPRRQAIQVWDSASSVAASALPILGGAIGGPLGAGIGVAAGGLFKLGTTLHGSTLERNIMETGQQWSQTFNLMSAGASLIGPLLNLVKNIITAPIKLFTTALKVLGGVIGGVTAIIMRGMKDYRIPITGLSGVTARSLAGWEAADSAFGLSRGTIGQAIEDFGRQRSMLYSSGQFNQERLIAAARLGVFSSVYGSTGTAEENYNTTVNSLSRQFNNAKTAREKEMILSLAGQIDGNLPQMLQTMQVLGMSSVSEYKNPGRFGVYWNERGGKSWDAIARNRGFKGGEAHRLRQDYYEFENSKAQFSMSMSRVSAWMWESFGKEIFSNLNRALDMAAQGNWDGLIEWAADVMKRIGMLLKHAFDRIDTEEWLNTIGEKFRKILEYISNIEIDGGTLGTKLKGVMDSIGELIFNTFRDLVNTLNRMTIHPEALLPGGKGPFITFSDLQSGAANLSYWQDGWDSSDNISDLANRLVFRDQSTRDKVDINLAEAGSIRQAFMDAYNTPGRYGGHAQAFLNTQWGEIPVDMRNPDVFLQGYALYNKFLNPPKGEKFFAPDLAKALWDIGFLPHTSEGKKWYDTLQTYTWKDFKSDVGSTTSPVIDEMTSFFIRSGIGASRTGRMIQQDFDGKNWKVTFTMKSDEEKAEQALMEANASGVHLLGNNQGYIETATGKVFFQVTNQN